MRTLVSRSLLTVVALGALCVSAAAQPRLWIVSFRSCPLVDFNQVQPAVDAAADGDYILVRGAPAGYTYGSFTIDGKSLVVLVDGMGDLAFSDITVRNIGPMQSVLLHGYARFGSDTDTEVGSLSLSDNQGSIWIQHLDVASTTGCGADVVRTTSALFVDCSVVGGPTGPGVRVEDSGVYAYESSFGSLGREGAVVESGTFFVSGSSVAGADGADGISGLGSCSGGLPGMTGLHAETGALVFTLDSTITGGLGGSFAICQAPFGGTCGVCPGGANGVPITGGGLVTSVAGIAHELRSVSPILEGESFSSTFTGLSGVNVAIFLSGGQSHFFGLGVRGLIAPALPGFAPLVGVMSAGGTFPLDLTMPTGLVDPGSANILYTQSLFQDPGSGALYVGAPYPWVILDENIDPFDGCNPTGVLWVDDDAPNDPGPGDPTISDPFEDGSLQHPFDALQEAVDTAFSGGVVRLRDGTYTGPGNSAVYTDDAVMIESENGATQCIVQGGTGYAFTLENTTASLRGLTILGPEGGVHGISGNIEIDNCVITAGLRGYWGEQPSNLTITASTVTGCGDSGIYLQGAATIDACTITDNAGLTGAGILTQTNEGLVVRNSLIARNTASSNGGGLVMLSGAQVIGCTFVGNTAGSGLGNAIYCAGSASMTDTILWGNGSGFQLFVWFGTLDATYCTVEGGSATATFGLGGAFTFGVGSLTTDPLFVSEVGGDYHLQAGSPCVDAGDPSYVALPGETDIDGEARVKNGRVDIGADER